RAGLAVPPGGTRLQVAWSAAIAVVRAFPVLLGVVARDPGVVGRQRRRAGRPTAPVPTPRGPRRRPPPCRPHPGGARAPPPPRPARRPRRARGAPPRRAGRLPRPQREAHP